MKNLFMEQKKCDTKIYDIQSFVFASFQDSFCTTKTKIERKKRKQMKEREKERKDNRGKKQKNNGKETETERRMTKKPKNEISCRNCVNRLEHFFIWRS